MNILDSFHIWSQTSSVAQKTISPIIPWRSFNELSDEEKETLFLHFRRGNYFWGYERSFHGEEVEAAMVYCINSLNNLYKKECYAKRTLKAFTFQNIYEDFKDIFFNKDEHIVYEMLSFYAFALIEKGQERTIIRMTNENDKGYTKRVNQIQFEEFDAFQKVLNEIFEDYKINIILMRSRFVPRQEELIIENIYKPVLEFLANAKMPKVDRELNAAFEAFGKSTPVGYSKSMTHCYTSVQALLQELVKDTKLGIKDANKEAVRLGLIPSDAFSTSAFKEILSTFEQLRMTHGDAHPKLEYANEKTAKLMLNLTMIYLQHCLII